MSKLIALCDGHGPETPGKRTPTMPDGYIMRENEFNRAVVAYLKIELERCGFRVLLVAPEDTDTPLETRVQRANNAKADLYVSVHANAFDATFSGANPEGVETFVYPSGESKRIGTIIHRHLLGGTKQMDRGVKDGAWLYVIANTVMPAVLVEAAFMDSPREAELLRSDAFRREVAVEIAKGICEAYGVKYVTAETPKPTPAPSPTPAKTEGAPITGQSEATVEQMLTFVREVNPKIDETIPKAYVEIGKKYGIRGDVAFAQAVKETNYFRFGGDVKPEQHNYAGIGATGGGVSGASFASIEEGVQAHIQHLYAYATKDAIPSGEKTIDPRFKLVTRGVATVWEGLNGKWAVPGVGYGEEIIAIHRKITETKPVTPAPDDWKRKLHDDALDNGIITQDWYAKIDEPAPIWFVLAVTMHALDKIREGK